MTDVRVSPAAGAAPVLPAFVWEAEISDDIDDIETSHADGERTYYVAMIFGPHRLLGYRWRWAVRRYGPYNMPTPTRDDAGEIIAGAWADTHVEAETGCQDAADEDYYGEGMAWWAYALRAASEREAEHAETG